MTTKGSSRSISRRRFLTATGVTAGAAALTLSGLGALGAPEPSVAFPKFALGETTMSNKILVAYASRAGSTVGVAEAIGRTLAEGKASVDVRPMKEVEDISPYMSVVAGSAIQGGKWLPEAMEFVRTHRVALAQRPFAAFLVCITLGMGDKYREEVTKWLDPVRALVRPVREGLFAGSLDVDRMPISFDALALRAAVAFGALPQGDHRDWEAIRNWAVELKPALGRRAFLSSAG